MQEDNINYEDDMCGVKFTAQKIQFYPEDLKKAETMSKDEKIDFFIKLRRENRFVVVDE